MSNSIILNFIKSYNLKFINFQKILRCFKCLRISILQSLVIGTSLKIITTLLLRSSYIREKVRENCNVEPERNIFAAILFCSSCSMVYDSNIFKDNICKVMGFNLMKDTINLNTVIEKHVSIRPVIWRGYLH